MSRIGRKPVQFDPAVRVEEKDRQVMVRGPQGELSLCLPPRVSVNIDSAARTITVTSATDSKDDRAMQGMARSLLNNMVTGVVKPFERGLEIQGVGYGAKIDGKTLVLQVGFCNDPKLEIPEGIQVTLTDAQHIVLKSPDRQKVGNFAAIVRRIRPPEPYKGKGIRYAKEEIQKKQGKAFVGGGE
jgi:large subunit ribosomal protein L6